MPNSCSLSRPPAYRLHRGTGQAVVTIAGRDIYLGKHNTAASRDAYQRTITEWRAGRRLLVDAKYPATVTEIVVAYAEFATNYYRKDGEPTNEVRMTKSAIKIARQLYGRQLAIDFGPLALKACRQQMIEKGWCRSNINRQTDRVKRMLKWATENEMVPGSVYEALRSVTGLKRGRTDAREKPRVQPVSETLVSATVQHLTSVVADMVQLQRLTGARPSEICDLRPCDVNRDVEPWEYVPQSHKTQHYDQVRIIPIGPKGQAILSPYLTRPAEEFCFSPAEAVEKHRAKRHAARKTPASCGNTIGSNRKRKPQRVAGNHYTSQSYFYAVRRACDKAFPVPAAISDDSAAVDGWRSQHRWAPNQLRHAAATEVRKKFGLEAAQVLLGHSKADTTEIYAERDRALAADVARQIG